MSETLFEDKIFGADFSEDRKYRNALWRIWDSKKSLVMFVGLNPSTANENTDDPTIRRVISFAKAWGYGGVYMMNLFTVVSSDPKVLRDNNNLGDFVHDKNILREYAKKCERIVFAWGNFKEAKSRGYEIASEFPNAYCLTKNKNGSPKHPIYVSASVLPVKFND